MGAAKLLRSFCRFCAFILIRGCQIFEVCLQILDVGDCQIIHVCLHNLCIQTDMGTAKLLRPVCKFCTFRLHLDWNGDSQIVEVCLQSLCIRLLWGLTNCWGLFANFVRLHWYGDCQIVEVCLQILCIWTDVGSAKLLRSACNLCAFRIWGQPTCWGLLAKFVHLDCCGDSQIIKARLQILYI